MLVLVFHDGESFDLAGVEQEMSRYGHQLRAHSIGANVSAVELGNIDSVVIEFERGDGFGACYGIRARSAVPIVMVTSRGEDVDVVAGLEAGADDYVVKPVSSRVLDARLRAVRRRTRVGAGGDRVRRAADPDRIVIDESGLLIEDHGAHVSQDGHLVLLTPTDRRLLVALAGRRGVPQTREQLLHAAWNLEYLGDSRIVDNAVQRLRVKIDTPGWSHIDTVRGHGYVFR